jgi:hypothetical protein
VLAVLVGAIAFAAKKYLPELLRRPPPATPPVMKNQEAAAPTPAPAPTPTKAIKKKPTHGKSKSHGHATGSSGDEAAPLPSGDAPLPPTPEE